MVLGDPCNIPLIYLYSSGVSLHKYYDCCDLRLCCETCGLVVTYRVTDQSWIQVQPRSCRMLADHKTESTIYSELKKHLARSRCSDHCLMPSNLVTFDMFKSSTASHCLDLERNIVRDANMTCPDSSHNRTSGLNPTDMSSEPSSLIVSNSTLVRARCEPYDSRASSNLSAPCRVLCNLL